MSHALLRHDALLDSERPLPSSDFERLSPAAVETDVRHAATQDRLMIKARHILDLVQKRDRHFQHPLMADHAMGVMLSLFLALFSAASIEGCASDISEPADKQDVIASLLGAGLIEVPVDDAKDKKLALTPLGAGRMRSFISAYPETV